VRVASTNAQIDVASLDLFSLRIERTVVPHALARMGQAHEREEVGRNAGVICAAMYGGGESVHRLYCSKELSLVTDHVRIYLGVGAACKASGEGQNDSVEACMQHASMTFEAILSVDRNHQARKSGTVHTTEKAKLP